MGRITSLITVGNHPYVGNKESKEIHLPDCIWVEKMNNIRNKTAFDKIERGIGQGYNGCIYCLPEHNTG